MREAFKKLILSTVKPVRLLKQNRDELLALNSSLANEVATLRTKNFEVEKQLSAATADLAAKATFVPPPPTSFDFDADGMKLWEKN